VQVEWYAPHQDPADLHIIFSVSKSVAGLLAGCLAGRGLLTLDAPVTMYVPEVAGSGFDGAAVRDLLDMTVNLRFNEDYGLNGLMRNYRQAAGWAPGGDGKSLREFLSTLERAGGHSERFCYKSVTTDLLGWVLERAGRAPYADLLSEHLWRPMGASQDAHITVDGQGTARAAGGISTTVRDMARIGQLLLDGDGVLPADVVADIKSAGSAEQWANGDFPEFLPGGSYRSCWYVGAPDTGICVAGGIHCQMIYVDTVRRVVVAKQSRRPVADDMTDDLAALALGRAMAQAYGE
jgi:CubicO group peptidase (beta-lactamase class C family)